MSTWIALLGPLYVESDGTERVVPAAKQRALLAALAVNANNVVSADFLAEAMWGAQAPPSSQDTIRTYVHRLRKCLGQEAGDLIVAQLPGYVLRARADELDLLKFESLVKAGRAGVAAAEWDSGAAALSQAEQLWRGTLFADIPARLFHDRYISYLEQTRLAAVELRIEAGTRMSRRVAAGLVPELQRLTTRHPERERLCVLLMLALYRASRQAEALAVFAQARRFSVTEFGVDPGPQLADMHKRVLAQDPALLAEPLDPFAFVLWSVLCIEFSPHGLFCA